MNSRNRVLDDTVVRCAIQHALKQLETATQYGLPLDECEEVFKATIRHLDEDRPGGPLESGLNHVHRLGPEQFDGWVWSEGHSDDVFGRSFRQLIQDNYGEPLCSPNRDELAQLAQGAQLLGDLLTSLSASALSHAHVIAVFPMLGSWGGKASSSQFRIPGTIFLSRGLLESPWQVAESLFHESLHQKLYDFRHGHSLLQPTYWRQDAPRVCSVWNVPDSRKSNYWDTHRAVAAFHVYVHLSLLCTIAEQRAPELENVYGPLRGPLTMMESRTAFERAHYLGEQIKELCWGELGPAGQGLIEKGSYLHLVLELYQKDAQKVEDVLDRSDFATGSSDLVGELMTLIESEVKTTRDVLATVNVGDEVSRFDRALRQYSRQELATNFGQVRRLIARTLLESSPDGYGLETSAHANPSPDEIVKQMVQSSSQHLDFVLASYL